MVATTLALFAHSVAASDSPIKPGNRELTFSGSLSRVSAEIAFEPASGGSLRLADDDVTALVVTANYGYFVTDKHEVGVIGGVRWIDDSNGSESDALGGLTYDLNFPRPDSQVVPVIGVMAQTVLFDGHSDYRYGVSAGLRVFANDAISVNSRLFFERSKVELEDPNFAGGTLVGEVEELGVRIGFSWVLR